MPSFRNVTPYVERHLVALSTTTQFEWFTDWSPCDGIDNIRAVLKSKNASGYTFQWQLAIQYASVRGDDAGPPALLGAAQAFQGTSGEYQTGDLSVAANMAANRLFRLGVAYQVGPGGSGVQQGDVALVASWKSVGTDLGSVSIPLAADDNGTKYEVLTRWMPATMMSKVKAAFMLNSVNGGSSALKYRLAYQTAGVNVSQPTAWTDAEAGWTTVGGTFNERNTGEIALTTSDMWFRLGVAYGLSGGVDTNATAQLDAICSCR